MVVWLAHESDESMCKPSNLKEVTLSVKTESGLGYKAFQVRVQVQVQQK